MRGYRKYPNLSWWLGTMDHNTLTAAEKEVLDLTYYCRRHGDRLSHGNAGNRLHRCKRTVRRARKRLEELLLRRSEKSKGSCKVGWPIEYKNEAEWRAVLRAQKMSLREDKMSTIFKEALAISPKRDIAQALVTTEPAPPREQVTHPLNPPQGGLGGSGEQAKRKHPQYKIYLRWGKGLYESWAEIESYADRKFTEWLERNEGKGKELCKKGEGQSTDSSAQ